MTYINIYERSQKIQTSRFLNFSFTSSADSILHDDSDVVSEGGNPSLPTPCEKHRKSLGPRTLSTVSAPCSAGSGASSQADSINTLTIAVPKLQTPNEKTPTTKIRSLKNTKYLSVPYK